MLEAIEDAILIFLAVVAFVFCAVVWLALVVLMTPYGWMGMFLFWLMFWR